MTYRRADQAKLRIIHDYTEFPGECLPGEEVIAIILIYRGRWYWIPWGPTHLIVGNFLARHRWIALDTWQIAAKMQQDPFVLQHGTNAPGHKGRPARTSPAGARQQLKRMRDVLARLIAEEGLDIAVEEIIRTERTSSGTARYRIVADVSWEHLPRLDDQDGGSDPHFPFVHPALLGSGGSVRIEAQW
jgi:5-carboxymethyl-2-hydroxymuconate isomerase